MFFHLEVRLPFFLDDVAKVMSFLNWTQFLDFFVYPMRQIVPICVKECSIQYRLFPTLYRLRRVEAFLLAELSAQVQDYFFFLFRIANLYAYPH